MNITQLARLFDDTDIPMLVIDAEQCICRENRTAVGMLMHAEQTLVGKYLFNVLPSIYSDGVLLQGNVDFPPNNHVYINTYLIQEGEDAGRTLVTIQNLTRHVMYDIYTLIYNLLSESIVICDNQARVIGFNDATCKFEGLLPEDALGKRVTELYHVLDKSGYNTLKTLETMQPRLNQKQVYATQNGKVIEAVGSTYPIFLNDQLFGTVCITEDYTKIDELTRKVVDLEAKLSANSDKKTATKKQLPTARYQFRDILCTNAKMISLIRKCKLAAQSDSAVMLYGETGTGKELFAQSIHNASHRADQPFVAVNCAAIPENLLESMLFGTVKGAFTGAENQAGLFEQANRGTLLLDELNSMSMSLQSKLLRVLQEGIVRRLGSSTDTPVDVRVISNINIPPQEAVSKGLLRSDLFYRLGVVSINILPLRERKEDILLLTKNYLMKYNKKLQKNVTGVAPEVEQIFAAYSWPGNVRELQHAIEHAMNVMPAYSSIITTRSLPDHIVDAVRKQTQAQQQEVQAEAPAAETAQPQSPLTFAQAQLGEKSLSEILESVEREILTTALEKHQGNVSQAARMLKTSRQQLKYRLDKYGIKG